jgi:hypothetical protein
MNARKKCAPPSWSPLFWFRQVDVLTPLDSLIGAFPFWSSLQHKCMSRAQLRRSGAAL